MNHEVRRVLALAEIKEAIDEFEAGEQNAVDTLATIAEACRVAGEPGMPKRDAA
jgi:hypothetical protein